MPKKYVFDVIANGTSDVVIEQDITNIPPIVHGLMAMDLWSNTETPADLNIAGDPTAGKRLSPRASGRRCAAAHPRFPAGVGRDRRSTCRRLTAPSAAFIFRINDLAKAKHPSMHKTDTLNYFCLLSGRLWALSEGKDVLLEPGDVLVQKGCMHGWRNDGPGTARIFCVLIDATWDRKGR